MKLSGAQQLRQIVFVGSMLLPLFSNDLARAEQVEISSSFNPVGSGARATGMGGAFIGIADDATASSWNPAGLVQLEKPEVSAVYSNFKRVQAYDSSEHPEIDGNQRMDADGLNYASVAYPFTVHNRNMTVSINYQRLYEMNKQVDIPFAPSGDLSGDDAVYEISFNQEGFLYALSPALAARISPSFSVGVTVNFWGPYAGRNGWENVQQSIVRENIPGGRTLVDHKVENMTAFEGINLNAGFLWNISGALTLGGVYKTGFDAELEQKNSDSIRFNVDDVHFTDHENTVEEQTLTMPASYGLGLSYRHSDTLTVGLDVYHTEWSSFVRREDDGVKTNPIDGNLIVDGRPGDTTQVRLGTEYLFVREKYVVPARFGLFYDPEPETGGNVEHYGLACGSGYQRGPVALDLAYQFRQGRNGDSDIPAIEDNQMALRHHTLMMSMIYYF